MGGERTDAYKLFPRVLPRFRTRNRLAAHAPSPDREPREWRQKHRAIVLIAAIAAVPSYLAISTIYATDFWNVLDIMAFDAKQSWIHTGNRLQRHCVNLWYTAELMRPNRSGLVPHVAVKVLTEICRSHRRWFTNGNYATKVS